MRHKIRYTIMRCVHHFEFRVLNRRVYVMFADWKRLQRVHQQLERCFVDEYSTKTDKIGKVK